MSINVTLFVQMVVFGLLVWFTMTYIWPVILQALDEREQRIADGLAAAEKGRSDLESAAAQAQTIIAVAREQARDILNKAASRATGIVDEARSLGEEEKRKRLESAKAEIDVEVNRARDELRNQVAVIAVAGAEKVLAREIDTEAHRDLLDRLAAEL